MQRPLSTLIPSLRLRYMSLLLLLLLACLLQIPHISALRILSPTNLQGIISHSTAQFGTLPGAMETSPLTVILASPENACQPLMNASQYINQAVLVMRGDCSFITKAINIQAVGAKAMLVGISDDTSLFPMGAMSAAQADSINIPCVQITNTAYNNIKNTIVNQRVTPTIQMTTVGEQYAPWEIIWELITDTQDTWLTRSWILWLFPISLFVVFQLYCITRCSRSQWWRDFSDRYLTNVRPEQEQQEQQEQQEPIQQNMGNNNMNNNHVINPIMNQQYPQLASPVQDVAMVNHGGAAPFQPPQPAVADPSAYVRMNNEEYDDLDDHPVSASSSSVSHGSNQYRRT